jgi:hypothetical protein
MMRLAGLTPRTCSLMEGETVKPEQEEIVDRALVTAMACGAGIYVLVFSCGVCCQVLLDMLGAVNRPTGNQFMAVVLPVSVASGIIAAFAGFWRRYHQS